MNDHKLGGPLKEYMECHLDGDVLLIYKPLHGGGREASPRLHAR